MSLHDDIKRGLSCDSIQDAATIRQKAVCLAAHPGRIALFPLVRWFERRYQGKYRFARIVFLFDLLLLGVALALAVAALMLSLFKPSPFADNIAFEADVAPREVVSGAPSTLVIRYANNTGEELRGAKLLLAFPAHFLLLDLNDAGASDGNRATETVDLGTIPIGGTGSARVRGVMFGDVGGDQTFMSTLTFVHGEKNVPDARTDAYAFRPVRSTLDLALTLPDRIVALQRIEGTLTYRNTGEIDFPEISIEPEWPEGFVFVSSNVPLANGTFRLPAIAAGAEGTMKFAGVLGDAAGTVTFQFHPSFTFGDDRYRQETLTHAAEVVPLPLQVSHSVDAESVRPGQSARVTVTYANIGEEAVENVRVGVESTSPFAKSKSVMVSQSAYPELALVEPGETGTVAIDFPLYATISQSVTSVYENIPFTTRAVGIFDMEGTTDATTRAGELTYVMTSPVTLDAFARFAAPSGDQIGRGPLPPYVGETTKYWVFWNLRGTTNELSSVRIDGELGANVTFTGRQTVSTNGGVVFDATTNEIVWVADSVSPTFSPSSKIVGIAFELALTPTDDQIGTIPTLIKNIRVTGMDAVTGAFVSASGATITTNLPNDTLAAGNATVE